MSNVSFSAIEELTTAVVNFEHRIGPDYIMDYYKAIEAAQAHLDMKWDLTWLPGNVSTWNFCQLEKFHAEAKRNSIIGAVRRANEAINEGRSTFEAVDAYTYWTIKASNFSKVGFGDMQRAQREGRAVVDQMKNLTLV